MEQPEQRDPPLHRARVALTGRLATMTRRQAWDRIERAGGVPTSSLSRRTTHLIVGMGGWPLLPDGTVSKKLQQAEQLNAKGARIEFISEAAFLARTGGSPREVAATDACYSADEVCALLGTSAEALRRWELLSLIQSNDGRYGYHDLVSLRTIADLVNAGVRAEVIGRSIRGLQAVLPDIQRPLAQLRIMAESDKALAAEIGGTRIAPDGQFLLQFDPPDEPEDRLLTIEDMDEDWLEVGQRLEDAERYEEAEQAYRKAIAEHPTSSEAYYNLGNVTRSLGRNDAAIECFRTALAHDQTFVEALYNLADILEERGAVRDAIRCLSAAVAQAPEFADAHFNLALCYERVGERSAARSHWAAYLRLDPTSEWAATARAHLTGS
jgi:tetratricopeptide (TPR) repeat protein